MHSEGTALQELAINLRRLANALTNDPNNIKHRRRSTTACQHHLIKLPKLISSSFWETCRRRNGNGESWSGQYELERTSPCEILYQTWRSQRPHNTSMSAQKNPKYPRTIRPGRFDPNPIRGQIYIDHIVKNRRSKTSATDGKLTSRATRILSKAGCVWRFNGKDAQLQHATPEHTTRIVTETMLS